ncbi:MAG: antitoxin VapB family protein [archaeon]|nr:antitoxin VapB family protein [archaeon]
MATKNISITEDAYRRLAALRKGNESFSEIIITITKKGKLEDFCGILSEESANVMKRSIAENRARHKKTRIKRLKRIAMEFDK